MPKAKREWSYLLLPSSEPDTGPSFEFEIPETEVSEEAGPPEGAGPSGVADPSEVAGPSAPMTVSVRLTVAEVALRLRAEKEREREQRTQRQQQQQHEEVEEVPEEPQLRRKRGGLTVGRRPISQDMPEAVFSDRNVRQRTETDVPFGSASATVPPASTSTPTPTRWEFDFTTAHKTPVTVVDTARSAPVARTLAQAVLLPRDLCRVRESGERVFDLHSSYLIQAIQQAHVVEEGVHILEESLGKALRSAEQAIKEKEEAVTAKEEAVQAREKAKGELGEVRTFLETSETQLATVNSELDSLKASSQAELAESRAHIGSLTDELERIEAHSLFALREAEVKGYNDAVTQAGLKVNAMCRRTWEAAGVARDSELYQEEDIIFGPLTAPGSGVTPSGQTSAQGPSSPVVQVSSSDTDRPGA